MKTRFWRARHQHSITVGLPRTYSDAHTPYKKMKRRVLFKWLAEVTQANINNGLLPPRTQHSYWLFEPNLHITMQNGFHISVTNMAVSLKKGAYLFGRLIGCSRGLFPFSKRLIKGFSVFNAFVIQINGD